MRPLLVVSALACWLLPVPQPPADHPPDPINDLVRAYLWPVSEEEFQHAQSALASDPSLKSMSRERFHDVEEAMRRGRAGYPPAPAAQNGRLPLQELSVPVPSGPTVPVLVQLPARYDPRVEWPLIFAMHGGPPGSPAQTRSGAERMIGVWRAAADEAGWIVAAPGLTPSITAGARTEQRLPYEVFHPEQAWAVISALRARYHINPDRIVSTGISLGSNYSIAFGTSHPGWFSAIVPVSTEGDSRELLLRNLKTVPIYILEGSRDQNIRGIAGPRALRDIVTSFGYDVTYREFADRTHEGFQEHYDDVLRWLDARPRNSYPREILRVPNDAITPLARRVYWIETDARQGFVAARVVAPSRIDVSARWTRSLKLYLHDRLVNLDRPVEVWVNGVKVYDGTVPRSALTALEQARARGDERLIDAAVISVDVPATPPSIAAAERSWSELTPTHAEGTLSFWETYATRALEERLPSLGFDAVEDALPAAVSASGEQIALRVRRVFNGTPVADAGLRSDDLIVSFGDEPFFRGRGGGSCLYRWLVRELRADVKAYSIVVWRAGSLHTLTARLKLGPYAEPKPSADAAPAGLQR
jgi:dienelactone hydrolase